MHLGQRHMKSEEWKTYRTRFLVKSKQLTSSLSFVDHLGRQHSGRKGDYLVETFDGVLSIAPRRIFEDIYVLMPAQEMSSDRSSGESEIAHLPTPHTLNAAELDCRSFEAIEIEAITLAKPTPRRRRDDAPAVDGPNRSRRKLPQPCRVHPGTRLGLM
jgi:hypothetical protein